MKSVVMLLFVFGCVAVVYVTHWSRRAVSATKEASVLFKETGSITETIRRLHAHESMPDGVRMSAQQREYVSKNLHEFMGIYRAPIEDTVAQILKEISAGKAAAGEPVRDDEWDQISSSIMTTVSMGYAKSWCELRGVT